MSEEELIRDVSEEELDRIRGWKKIYEESHAIQPKAKPNFIKEFGIEIVATVIASIGAIVLAAISTGAVFLVRTIDFLKAYGISTGVQNFLGWVAAPAALCAVEGYLAAKGIQKGRKSGSTKTSNIGMLVAFVISILAGIANSLQLIQNVGPSQGVINWLLVLATGAGASALAYYGAENFGGVYYDWDILQKKIDAEYEEYLGTWNEKFQGDYRRRGRGLWGLGKYEVVDDSPAVQTIVTEGEVEVTKHVKEWLDSHHLTAYDIGLESEGKVATPQNITIDLRKEDQRITANSVRTALSRLRH